MSLVAKIHVAKKHFGLDEDTYRAVLERVTGKASLRLMSEREQRQVVEYFRGQGFAPVTQFSRKGKKPLTGPFAKKLQALWISAWNLGIIRSAEDKALVAFVKRQSKVDHVRFLTDPVAAASAIDGLKAWMTREAGVDWSTGIDRPIYIKNPSAAIAIAQYGLFDSAKHVLSRLSFREAVEMETGIRLEMMSREDWQAVTKAFGKVIRKELVK
jgi:hypothetical protein